MAKTPDSFAAPRGAGAAGRPSNAGYAVAKAAKTAKRKALAKKIGTGIAVAGGVGTYLYREKMIADKREADRKEREKLKKLPGDMIGRKNKQDYEDAVDTIKKG